MRVIAGAWKGVRLAGAKGMEIRPTTDRVKESMFSLLGINVGPLVAVDLFAGSGALGIEAMSRGCESCIFVDKSPRSLQIVQENLTRCKAEKTVEIWKSDWKRAIQRIAREDRTLGWVFVDPPYKENLWVPVLEFLHQYGVNVQEGVVCEHPKGVVLPRRAGPLEVVKERVYGDIAVTLYRVCSAIPQEKEENL